MSYDQLRADSLGRAGLSFNDWMKRCSSLLESHMGVGADDFPDQTWLDWYDDGMTPREAVNLALENEGVDLSDE